MGIPLQQAGFQDIGLFALRLSIGVLFVIHGYRELSGESRKKEMSIMQHYGMPKLIFNVVAVYELVGGLLLVLGFLARLVSVLFAILLVAIIFFNVTKMSQPPVNKRYVNGWDRDTVLLAGTFLLVLVGPGILSIGTIANL